MDKIGIMGGTFNPIHNAHLIMAKEARQQFHLNKVLFMPSKNPPHKAKKDIASDSHRTRMIQHAICDYPYFEYSDMELKRDGVTYTKDTLAALKQEFPHSEIYFILGGDSLESFESWCEPAYILKNCHILAANRGHVSNEKITHWIAYYKRKYGAQISQIEMPSIEISSDMLRKKLTQGNSIQGYTPSCVEYYIRSNTLYGTTDFVYHTLKNEEVYRILASCLTPKRYQHTLSVAVTAANLAVVHGIDQKKAYLSGLLHDCAKYLNGEELVSFCDENAILITDVERKNSALIHGKVGAYFAQTKYGVHDLDVLHAISYHTTGRPAMTRLEQIIYLADYIEPNRNMKCKPHSLSDIRKVCFLELNDALRMVLENTLTYLEKSGSVIDPLTLETYKYYQN